MAWVAFDRMIRNAEEFGLEGPLDRWHHVRQRIYDNLYGKGFDPELGSFVQAYGSKDLDASLLLLPSVGFLPPSDPKVQGTVRVIEQRLLVEGTFVLPYGTAEASGGLALGEGAFLACSFWLVDNLLLQCRREEALQMFERLLALRSNVGLLAEEDDPVAGRLVGNVPQALAISPSPTAPAISHWATSMLLTQPET